MRAALLACALALAACSYPDGPYQACVDADPGAAIVLSPTSVQVDEGAGTSIMVKLSEAPAHQVVVDLASSLAAAHLNPSSVTFDATNFATAKTVTLNADADANVVDEMGTISATGDGATAAAVDLTVHDHDVMTIQVTGTPVDVNEKAQQNFGVFLSNEPTGTIVIHITPNSPAQNAVSPTMVSFDKTSYLLMQAVTVQSFHDTNTVSEDTTLAVTATGVPEVDVTVHNHDTGP
jgi:hypothetical protein